MKDEVKIFILVALATFIAVSAALFVARPVPQKNLGNTTSGYPLTTIISGSVAVPTGTSTLVSLPDLGRNFARLCNADASANIYLGFSNYTSTATNTAAAIGYATTSGGSIIFPKTCDTLDNKGNLTFAQINATASPTAASLFYMFGR